MSGDGVVVLYALAAVVAFVIGVAAFAGCENSPHMVRERRAAARIALLAPLWPILAAVGIWRGLGSLIRAAELRGRR